MYFPPTTVQSRTSSPLGPVALAASELGLVGAWFTTGQRYLPEFLEGARAWPMAPSHPVLRLAEEQLNAYFAQTRSAFELPLDLRGGTPFQQAVWQALLDIPTGTTTTYGTLSQRLGKPSAMRAVGAAVGRNPISIIVPCHRVLGADGSLTGYAGGLDRKTALLAHEGSALAPPPLKKKPGTPQYALEGFL